MAKWLLDPGHGGTDPGATYKSRKESDDVLRLSLRVGEILKANNENVYYTRSIDTTVSLSERSSKENAGNYDYFISIHRNANKPETAKGVETYIYARGRISEVLASKVNNTELGSAIKFIKTLLSSVFDLSFFIIFAIHCK